MCTASNGRIFAASMRSRSIVTLPSYATSAWVTVARWIFDLNTFRRMTRLGPAMAADVVPVHLVNPFNIRHRGRRSTREKPPFPGSAHAETWPDLLEPLSEGATRRSAHAEFQVAGRAPRRSPEPIA